MKFTEFIHEGDWKWFEEIVEREKERKKGKNMEERGRCHSKENREGVIERLWNAAILEHWSISRRYFFSSSFLKEISIRKWSFFLVPLSRLTSENLIISYFCN